MSTRALPPAPGLVRDLLRASHPLPALAVTAFATALSAGAGAGPARAARVGAAVAAGQLAIGWANDAVDADLDAAAGRTSGPGAKPVAAGRLSRGLVAAAAVAATATAVPLSLRTGRRPGALHLAGLAAGLAYDVGLKSTLASPLPYAAFFGALPAVAVGAARGSGRPPVLLCAVAGTVGVAAHLANTLKDVEADAATGVRGLPQRLGPGASRVGAAVLLTGADAALLLAGGAGLSRGARALLASAAATGTAGALSRGPGAFRAVLAAAALTVAGVLAAGPVLLGPPG